MRFWHEEHLILQQGKNLFINSNCEFIRTLTIFNNVNQRLLPVSQSKIILTQLRLIEKSQGDRSRPDNNKTFQFLFS